MSFYIYLLVELLILPNSSINFLAINHQSLAISYKLSTISHQSLPISHKLAYQPTFITKQSHNNNVVSPNSINVIFKMLKYIFVPPIYVIVTFCPIHFKTQLFGPYNSLFFGFIWPP